MTDVKDTQPKASSEEEPTNIVDFKKKKLDKEIEDFEKYLDASFRASKLYTLSADIARMYSIIYGHYCDIIADDYGEDGIILKIVPLPPNKEEND